MRAPLVVVCLLAFAAGDAHARKPAKCGHRSKQTVVSTITLTGPRAEDRAIPTFYFQNERQNNVMFFRPEDAITTLGEMIVRDEKVFGEGKAKGQRGLLAEIEKDLPLREHTDLYKYAFRDSGHRLVAELLVTELLRAGRASVGYWNYFDPHPKVVSAPTTQLTLYILEYPGQLFSAEFCSEWGLVYSYFGEIE